MCHVPISLLKLCSCRRLRFPTHGLTQQLERALKLGSWFVVLRTSAEQRAEFMFCPLVICRRFWQQVSKGLGALHRSSVARLRRTCVLLGRARLLPVCCCTAALAASTEGGAMDKEVASTAEVEESTLLPRGL